jgi:hypothetical protein
MQLRLVSVVTYTTSEIIPWIAEMYRCSRDIELGIFGSCILPSTSQEQSANWNRMTLQYLSRTIHATHKFILGACTES